MTARCEPWNERALLPKRALQFVIGEYLAPLLGAERVFLVAALLCSLMSAAGVQQRLGATYGAAFGWAGAVGLELIYVGSAIAGSTASGRAGGWLLALAGGAALIAMALNFAQHEAMGHISWHSYVESIGFPLLAVGCSFAAHAIGAARQAEAARAAEQGRLAAERERAERERAERERAEQDEQARIAREQRQAEHEFTLAQIRAQAEAEAVKIQARATSRAASRDAALGAVTPRTDAASSTKTVDRAKILPALRDAATANPRFSRTEFARQHGISRPMVNKLLAELEGAAEAG